MQPHLIDASMSGLFRLIFIFVLIYALYNLLVRVVFPSMVRKQVKNFQDQFQQQSSPPPSGGREGEVNIRFTGKQSSETRPHQDAEDVDYEEIK